jgi:hypothetical protein
VVVALVLAGLAGSLGTGKLAARTSQVAGFTVVSSRLVIQAIAPQRSEAEARAAALRKLAELRPDVSGLAVVGAYHDPAVLTVVDSQGNPAFSTGWPMNAWVFWMTAPPQAGFLHVDALAIVDAITGKVDGAQVRMHN